MGRLGQVLKSHRANRGVSQAALARATGLNASYINQIEHGKKAHPSMEVLLKIAGALRLTAKERDQIMSAAGMPRTPRIPMPGQFRAPVSLSVPRGRSGVVTKVDQLLSNPDVPMAARKQLLSGIRALARLAESQKGKSAFTQ